MDPDNTTLKKEALDTCFEEKSLMDKVIDTIGMGKVVEKFSTVKPFIKSCNLANPTDDSNYDGEGANKAIVAGIKVSF